MQLLNEVRNHALRGRMPALLAIGMMFIFVLSACQVAVADDGTIQIKPESTKTASGNDVTASNIRTGLLSQAAESTTNAPINPDQVYEWNGLVRWADLEGGHFVIDRGCDAWAVIPQDDELYSKLKELEGGRGTVWGNVGASANIYGRRAIEATAVFGPNDPRPAIAMPQVPCPDEAPAPSNHIAITHSEVTLHGELVWRGSGLWLVTPRGNVRLALPATVTDAVPGLSDALERARSAAAEAAGDSSLSFSLGEYGVVGMWDLANTGLVVRVRDIKAWPHRTFVRDHCGGGFHHFVVGDEQVAVHGTLVIMDDGQWLLRTRSGVVFIHRTNSDAALVDPATGERTAITPEVPRRHDVVVTGQWKTDGSELHMEAAQFVRVKTVCDDPQPPREPILPGEIAAIGTLVFNNGQPYLNTPSGRILLFRQNAVVGDEPQPVDPSFFGDIAPEVTDAAGANGDTAAPDVVRPVRYILVVGKWQIVRDQLAIFVRYARPWPYPHVQPVEPEPMPFPLPPAEPTFGRPTDPVTPDEVRPEDRPDRDVVIIGPDGTRRTTPSNSTSADPKPADTTTASGMAVNSFTAASAK